LFGFETPLLESHCCLGVFIAAQKGILEYFKRQLKLFSSIHRFLTSVVLKIFASGADCGF
jgi:hypothetical protein